VIQFDEKADLGHCQMVDEVNLSYHTQNGWRLLAVVQDTFSTPMPLTIPAYNDHNGTWHPERTTTEYVPATSTRFLLTKTSDQTLQDLSRQLQSQEREILELRSALEKAKPLQTQLDQVTKARTPTGRPPVTSGLGDALARSRAREPAPFPVLLRALLVGDVCQGSPYAK